MFLADLTTSLPNNALIAQANDFVAALIALQPAEESIVQHFMTAMRGAADFISAQNTDIFAHASEVSNMITKEDVIAIYKELPEEDRSVVWKYISKLYSLGKKAAPELVQEGDFDFNALTVKSPIHGLISTAKSCMSQSAGSAGDDTVQQVTTVTTTTTTQPQESSGLITTAFRQMALTMLTTVHNDCADNADVMGMCSEMKRLIESEPDPQCLKLIAAFKQFYNEEDAQQLVMEAEATIRAHGIPLLPGGAELSSSILDTATNKDAIVSSVMQFATVFVTLTSMDDEAIIKMENLASKFYLKVQSGELSFENNTDPMSMLATLASSDLSEDIMSLVGGM